MVYDACVLYPAQLRDLLMYLALSHLFCAKWTDEIHDEWTRGLLADRQDLTVQQVQRIRDLMDQALPDSKVTGYEPLVPGLSLPDPDDRHVLAAAIRGNADAIITLNLRDFPQSELDRHGIEAMSPDAFVALQLRQYTFGACQAIQTHRASLKRPPKTVDEYLTSLEQAGLKNTVAELRRYRDLI